MIEIGFEFTHKLTGERMRVIRDFSPVFTCEKIDQPKILNNRTGEYQYPRAISHISNIKPQFELF